MSIQEQKIKMINHTINTMRNNGFSELQLESMKRILKETKNNK